MLKQHSTSTDKLHFIGMSCVTLGFLFFLGLVFQFDASNIPAMAFAWPAILILPGAFLMVAGVARHRAGNFMTAAGGVMIGSGLVLLVQDVTDAWGTWVYAWAMAFPVAMGVAEILQGLFTRQTELLYDGLHTALVGFSTFIMGFLIFEVVFNLSGFSPFNSSMLRMVIAVALVSVGGLFLARITSNAQDLPDEYN